MIGIAEVDQHLDLAGRRGVVGLVGHVDVVLVADEGLRHAVDLGHLEVGLVDVEHMQLRRGVADRPFLDRADLDGRVDTVRVELHRSGARVDVEGVAVGRFVEGDRAPARHRQVAEVFDRRQRLRAAQSATASRPARPASPAWSRDSCRLRAGVEGQRTHRVAAALRRPGSAPPSARRAAAAARR